MIGPPGAGKTMLLKSKILKLMVIACPAKNLALSLLHNVKYLSHFDIAK